MDTKINKYKNIYYPPGGILIWIIILLELITFGMALISLVYMSTTDPMGYHESSNLLNRSYGAINTLFLIISGYFMARSLKFFKQGNRHKTSIYLILTMAGGFLFLILKAVEYAQKIGQGLILGYDSFFNFYWLLTGFHVIHVLVGLIILISVYLGLKKDIKSIQLDDFEASAAFWHMCDLIWLLLFPVLYLIL